MQKDLAKEKVRQLVESYDSVVRLGKKGEYSEADVGSKFILPLLSALGWDVTKIEDVKEQRRTLTGVADYSLFNVGGTAKIFLELKKFEEDLDGSRRVGGKVKSFPQITIDYAWQSRADWAVLTNFEETRLYYSRVKKPEEGLIFRLRYNDFLASFDKLWLISRDGVVSGLLDTFEKRRLRRDVDEELLKDLVYCRKLLVANVRKNNPQLSKEDINEATQKILDRLMFIRSCEDRLIIPAESLWTQFSVWQKIAIDKSVRTFMMDLKNIFRDFDAVYNGQLFALHLCEDLRIDNEVLESVLILLYNYNFDLIPVDVLGNAYELYIGTIIKEKEGTLKEDELTLVEEPSVRKKHGIYYTPEYVVDYIVRNTLGEILKNCKTVDEVSKIKVLDPACGSGSFLIKAFDVIKEWYDNYNRQNQRAATRNTLDAHFQAVPNVEEKILTENIYGVDLDPQAVEITIMNLSLKAVKTKKKLPYMGDHIKCGNSIIFDQPEKIKEFFGENWIEKKPFNWKEEFPEVFAQEGFDVVIANPPYYNIQTIKDQHEKQWLEKTFKNVFTGESDIHYFFYARGIELLKPKGLLGFISSRYFIEATQAEPFRRFIQSNCKIILLLDFGSIVKIFRDATINTIITILEKTDSENERQNNQIKVVKVSSWKNDLASLINHILKYFSVKNYSNDNISIFEVAQRRLTPEIWQLTPVAVESIITKVSSKGVRLADLCDVFKSLESGLDAVSREHLATVDRKGWRFTPSLKIGEPVFRINLETIYGKNLEIEACRPLLTNENIKRYMLDWKNEYLIFLLDDSDIEKYPNIKSHLLRYKPLLEERYDAKNRGIPYYAIANPRNINKILSKKDRLITPYIAPENRFAYVHGGDNYIYKSDVYVIMPKDECPINLKFIQGILNSKLFEFMHKHTAKAVDGAARTSKGKMGKRFSYQAKYVSLYPILLPKTGKEEKICEEIKTLADKITEAKRKYNEINVDFNKHLTEPIISYTIFKDYIKKFDVKDKEALDKTSKGTIRRIKIEERDTWLTFKVDYVTKTDKTKEEFTEFPVLKCRFENVYLRKFLLYVFLNYKKRWGSGNLLATILNTPIPCFDKNPEKNNQIIEKIMKEFLKAVEEKERLEKEIQQTDKTIDSKIYELYGLTPEEISIVENSLKQK